MNTSHTRQELIDLFTFNGPPYRLQYRTLGLARKMWIADMPVLDQLRKDGLVEVLEKKRNSILYQYNPKP
jgi:hypothetical protein